MEGNCPICGRPLGDVLLEEHHLIPRTFKGRDTITIHKMCHQKIHATFAERELQQYYHTPERIREHSVMETFIKWISKKPLEFYDKNDDTTDRKRKRKN
jgi:hypothetical protein